MLHDTVKIENSNGTLIVDAEGRPIGGVPPVYETVERFLFPPEARIHGTCGILECWLIHEDGAVEGPEWADLVDRTEADQQTR